MWVAGFFFFSGKMRNKSCLMEGDALIKKAYRSFTKLYLGICELSIGENKTVLLPRGRFDILCYTREP